MSRFPVGVTLMIILIIIVALLAVRALPLPKPAPGIITVFCQQVREQREADCVMQLENEFMDEGGNDYTRTLRLKAAKTCRRIGETVFLACKNDNGE